MRYSPIAGRYARALLNVAISRGKEEEFLEYLRNSLEVYKRMMGFFNDPTILPERKVEAMREVFDNFGIEIEEAFFNFLEILFEKKRQKYLPLIVEYFKDMKIESERKVPVHLTVAHPLDEEEKELLRKFIKKHSLLDPIFTTMIDPELVAGAVIEFEGYTMDLTVKGRLKRIARDVFERGERS